MLDRLSDDCLYDREARLRLAGLRNAETDDREGRTTLCRQCKNGRPGSYKVTYRFNPPEGNGFYRHSDQETGLPPWWQPFSQTFTFTYPQKIAASTGIGLPAATDPSLRSETGTR